MLGVVRRNPQFRRLWSAQVVSQAGDWLNRMAVLALIGDLAGGAAQVGMGVLFGGELALRMLPTAAFGPLAGGLADRLPRRLVMIVSDILRAVVVLGFLAVDTPDELGLLYGLLLTQMSLAIFFDASRSASLPNTVPREELYEAYTLSAATWSAMLAFGAFAGGVLLEVLGLAGVFLIDAGTYVVSAFLLASLELPPTPKQAERLSVRDVVLLVEMKRAFRHVRSLGILPILFVKVLWSMAGGYLVLLSVLGHERFTDEQEPNRLAAAGFATSLLYAARGVGTGLGPILARRYIGSTDGALRNAILGGFFLAAAFYALVPFAPNLTVAWFLVLVAHMGGSAIWVSSTTFWQRRVSDAYRGRVFSLEFLMMTIAFTAWGFLIGGLYDRTGSVDTALWVTSAAACCGGALWAFVSRPALDQPTP
ncbi:MAG: MFS transporter [bacterium]|nr:MFS transporter [bacterium]